MEKATLQIDLIYDIICPWCYVGHQRLLNAIKKTKAKVEISLVPYQIRPNISNKGMLIQEYWKEKGIVDLKLAYEKIKEAAEIEGLGFEPHIFSKIPNTLKIHQVILLAQEQGFGMEVLHTIQTAYFARGVDLTVLDNIIDLVVPFLSEKEVLVAWNDKTNYQELVLRKEQEVKSKNITVVPTYIINKKQKLTGAVSNYTLVDMLKQLAPKEEIGEFCDLATGEC